MASEGANWSEGVFFRLHRFFGCIGCRGSFLSRGSFRIASKFGVSEMIGDRPCKREC